MAAKNKTRRSGFDIRAAVVAHVEASSRAREWAAKCFAFREAGKTAHAKAAEKKARHWLLKALNLETRAARAKAQGGRGGEL
jgi:hypothetical protein